jgi:hypothetical protein
MVWIPKMTFPRYLNNFRQKETSHEHAVEFRNHDGQTSHRK